MRFANQILSYAILAPLCSAAFSTPAAAGPPQVGRREALACAAASSYVLILLAEVQRRHLVFSTDQDPISDLPAEIGWFDPRTGKTGAAPPKNLLRALKAGPARSAVAICRSVQDTLQKHKIAFGEKAVKEAQKFKPGTALFRADVTYVSMPLLSRDGQSAVLVSSSVAGPTAGGGYLQYLRRLPTGRWVVASSAELWVA